jgi:hypothetical protein
MVDQKEAEHFFFMGRQHALNQSLSSSIMVPRAIIPLPCRAVPWHCSAVHARHGTPNMAVASQVLNDV